MTTTHTTPTRKILISRFHLTKTNTRAYFQDGHASKQRTIYTNNNGELFVFYNNDLHTVKTYKCEPYTKGMEKLLCYLGAGYSWYH